MDTDIALAGLPSGMAVPIGAEDGGGVHNAPPGCAWKRAQRSMSGPIFVTSELHHGLVQSYQPSHADPQTALSR